MASASSWNSVEMVLKWRVVADCSRRVKQQPETLAIANSYFDLLGVPEFNAGGNHLAQAPLIAVYSQ